MKYAVRFHFHSTFENYLWHINTLILCNGIEWKRWRRCPARCGLPSTIYNTRCTDASGCSGPRTVNQCRGTISQVRELSYRPVTVLGCVSSSYVSVWISCYIAAYDLVVYVIFIVYMTFEYTLVAYKHTYFVKRNRMKCGHGRNLFYVSRSCFSFYLHTFLTHLNKWNTRWDFIFIRHLKTTCGI